MLAQRENPPIRLRELMTIYFTVVEYHALEILCHRLICLPMAEERSASCHRNSLANALGILRKLYKLDPRSLVRVCWPLLVTADSVEDPEDKRWIQQAVEEVRRGTGSSVWLSERLDSVWAGRGFQQPLKANVLSPCSGVDNSVIFGN